MSKKNTTYYILHTTYSKGQAVLIVMLVMVVALTVGLALISRTTTDIKISQQQEESARAFSAAEAGIEELLKSGQPHFSHTFAGADESGASVVANLSTATGRSKFFFPDEIAPGQTATLWLNGHDANGNFNPTAAGQYSGNSFNLCWNGEAVEVSVYYKTGSNYEVKRGAYDSDGGRRGSNHFSAPDGGGCLDLARKKTITFSALGVPGGSTLLFANLKPYYGVAKIGVEASGSPFPSQGHEIESTGLVGEITRKVRVFRAWPAPPAVFDYGVFSGSGLVKSTD